jgi:acetolactate synthase-1/2/3 large subunit
MTEADLVVTVGRRLDFQLAYGSPAVFGEAKFLRIADCASELRDNRRGAAEIFATPSAALDALLEATEGRKGAADRQWAGAAREKHLERANKLVASMKSAPAGKDGLMHPNRLLAALREALPSDAVIVADGGDFLSFARVGLPASTYLDPGSLGCIGIGTPFGVAASLALPDRTVVVATGDGSFGFNAMEIDTAARHKAPVLIVVANNGSWAIECARSAGNARQGGRHPAAVRRSRGDGAGLRPAWRAVERAEDLPAAIERALANRPALWMCW